MPTFPGHTASSKLIHELLQVFPLDEDDVVLLQNFFELRAGHYFIVALTPCRAVVGVIQSYSLQLGIVMTEVDNHFRKARMQIFHAIDIQITPLLALNAW